MTASAVRRPDDPGRQGVPDVLRADAISVQFGGLVAVRDVSFTLPEGGIVSLIGPNGAGKTTFFNVLTGLYTPTTGRVELDGAPITGLPPHQIAARGLGRTFQNIRLFGLMTATENVMVAMHAHLRSGLFGTIMRTPRQRREEDRARDEAHALLDFVGIGGLHEEYARNLSYGDQRRLEVARALAVRPRALLLDEPTAGMNPRESAQFVEFVRRVRDNQGVSVLIIEHDMNVVMRVSERVTVLDRGERIAEGTPEQVRADDRVVEAYLGRAGAEGGNA